MIAETRNLLDAVVDFSRFIVSRVMVAMFALWLVGDYSNFYTIIGELDDGLQKSLDFVERQLSERKDVAGALTDFVAGVFNSTLALAILVVLLAFSNFFHFLLVSIGHIFPPRLRFLSLEHTKRDCLKTIFASDDFSGNKSELTKSVEATVSEVWSSNQRYTQRIHETVKLLKGSAVVIAIFWVLTLPSQYPTGSSIYVFVGLIVVVIFMQLWLINSEFDDFTDLKEAIENEVLALQPELLDKSLLDKSSEFTFWLNNEPIGELSVYGEFWGPFRRLYRSAWSKDRDPRMRRSGKVYVSHGEIR